MKFIAIIGPHGAGKDTIIPRIVGLFEKQSPGLLQRAIFTLSRQPREGEINGESSFFVSREEFMSLVQKGVINYYEPVGDYLAGTMISELRKAGNVIANITLSGLEGNSRVFDKAEDKIFTVLLDAPPEQRRQRILKRNPSIKQEYLNFRLTSDPSANLDKKKFDLYLNNTDGDLEAAVAAAYSAIKNFIL
jgi:guanylate kinase